jgi:large subunit ribosomal protein L27
MGRDFTIHAKVDGNVAFRRSYRNRMFVSIVPAGAEAPVAVAPAPKKAAAPKAKAAPAPKAAPVVDAAPVQAVADIPAAKPAKKAKVAKIELPSGKKIKQDDLKMVEGIGPKIEGLLHDIGIKTWRELADAPEAKVQQMLDDAGPRYRIHSPSTWAKQAGLAADAKWAELEKLQDELDGGKEVK